MHTTSDGRQTSEAESRTANLLGALALEAVSRQEAAIHEVVGQGGAVAAAIVTLHKYPDRGVEQLREPLGLSQPGATRLVERLVAQGLVERSGPGGRRGVALRLTDAGVALFDRLLAARRAALAELLAPLPEGDRETLAGLLEQLLGARSSSHADTERLCRLCERRCCSQCPVAIAAARAKARGA
jgi:MarR family transcriptional regulator, negative regulator of the multidrug operon emrRAB